MMVRLLLQVICHLHMRKRMIRKSSHPFWLMNAMMLLQKIAPFMSLLLPLHYVTTSFACTCNCAEGLHFSAFHYFQWWLQSNMNDILFSMVSDPWYPTRRVLVRSTFDDMESGRLRAEQDRAYEECLESDITTVSSVAKHLNYVWQVKIM